MPHRSFDQPGGSLLDDYGWTARVAERFRRLDASGAPARVVRTDRGAVLVATADGVVQVDLPPGFEPAPVAGDWLALGREPLELLALAPRRNALVRRDHSGSQALAADVDEVLVVSPLDRPLVPGQIDRAIVMACDCGAGPVVVLTKADLCDDAPAVAARAADLVPGVEVVVTSSVDGDGIDELRGRLAPGKTVALLGESGVGKSSLVNALTGQSVQRTAAVRERDRFGRHTTRARHLVPAGGGAVLVDTPGLRTFGVVGLDRGLAGAFADVESHAAGCRFSDCGHGTEPGCAITAAVSDGTLAPERLERYRGLAAATRAEPRRGRRRGARHGGPGSNAGRP